MTNFADALTGRFPVGLATTPAGELLYLSRGAGSLYRIAFGTPVASGSRPLVAVGAGAGGSPAVATYDPLTGNVVARLLAFEPGFAGGVRVATADLDRDGYADLLVGADRGGGPRVRVLNGRTGATLADFFAFETTFTGGVRLAAGDVTGDGVPELVVAAGTGGGPRSAPVAGAGRG